MHASFIIPTGSLYIDLPLWFLNTKACISIQNDANRCFMYAVQCGVYEIYKKPHPERKTHYDHDKFKKEIRAIEYVNFEHCYFPMEMMMKLMKLKNSKKIMAIEYQ